MNDYHENRARRRREIAEALGELPRDVWNVNLVQDARYRRVEAHLSGVKSSIEKADANETQWIAEVRAQKVREAETP